MKDFKYSIELFLKDENNTDLAEVEFSKAIALPKKLFYNTFHIVTLHYQEDELEIANQHCSQLNREIQNVGYNSVEFKIKEIKV